MASNWHRYDLVLELVEELATWEGWISSEQELSQRFDNEIAPLVIEQYGEGDEPAMNEAFSNWVDSLCREGEIHEQQNQQYTYVGKYS